MSIQEHLNKIRNAIYGREVRESIAKGIETAYDDASEKDNANMEVKIARGTHPNLRSRLEEVDDKQQQTTAQLAQTELKKLNRNENESITKAMLSKSLKEEINNGEINVNVNTSDIENGAVVSNKLDGGVVTGKNLFNKKDITEGFYYNSNGVLTEGVASTGVDTLSHFISIGDETVFNRSHYSLVTQFNSMGDEIGTISGGVGFVELDENTERVRVSLKSSDLHSYQFEKGHFFTGYEPYKFYLDNLNQQDKSQEPIKIKGFRGAYLDKSKISYNYYISSSSGIRNYRSAQPERISCHTDYIDCSLEDEFERSHDSNITFYDEDLNFISGWYSGVGENTVGKFKRPPNAKKMIISMRQVDVEDFVLTSKNYTLDGLVVNRDERKKTDVKLENSLIKTKNANAGVFRVATFNLKFVKTKVEATSEIINQSGASVVGHQEVYHGSDFDFYENYLGWNMVDGSFGANLFVPDGSDYGNAILSDYKVMDSENGFLNMNDTGLQQRGWLRSVVLMNGKLVSVYSTHLTPYSSETPLAQRTSELLELLQIIENDESEYVILTGDFNNESMAELDIFTDKGYKLANDGEFITSDTGYAKDNIIVSSNIEITKKGMIEHSGASDHNLVWCDVLLKN